MKLPAIPKPGAMISPDAIVALEIEVSRALATIDDVDVLQEWRARAAALEAYLRGKDLNGPMLGAQRRVEARIGQLLGDNGQGCRNDLTSPCAVKFSSTDRQRFRVLARGLDRGLPDEEWRQAREPLLALIQLRFPMPRHIPTIVQSDGKVKKPRAERVKEIETRAECGMRAAQIAADIGIDEKTVRLIANAENIVLPDAAIGGRARLDITRILTETINGVDAYVSGLSMLDDAQLPELTVADRSDLMQALARSINGLKKLRTKMERAYAGHDASAA